MARSILPGERRANLNSLADLIGEALCVVECVIASLDTRDHSGPELPALQCVLRGLNEAHDRLADSRCFSRLGLRRTRNGTKRKNQPEK